MATDAAEWPSKLTVPRATKDLLNRFYKLADTNSEDVGREYAETMFTSDGAILVNKRKFQGKQGTCRLPSRRIVIFGFDPSINTLLTCEMVYRDFALTRRVVE